MADTTTYGLKRRLTESRVLAVTILQEHVDATADAVLSGTWDNISDLQVYPLRIATVRDVVEFTEPAQSRQLFDTLRARLITAGVDHFAQIVRKAYFTSSKTIYGEYEGIQLRHGQPMAAPFRTGIELKLVDGVWRQSGGVLLNECKDWEGLILKVGAPVNPITSAGEDLRAKVWAVSREATTICERMLHESATALREDDFASFRSQFALPFNLITFGSSFSIENETDIRAIFDDMRRHLSESGVTELERDCIAAKFTNEREIHVTYVTTFKRDGTVLREPFPITETICLIEDQWRITHCQSAIEDTDPPVRLLSA